MLRMWKPLWKEKWKRNQGWRGEERSARLLCTKQARCRKGPAGRQGNANGEEDDLERFDNSTTTVWVCRDMYVNGTKKYMYQYLYAGAYGRTKKHPFRSGCCVPNIYLKEYRVCTTRSRNLLCFLCRVVLNITRIAMFVMLHPILDSFNKHFQ